MAKKKEDGEKTMSCRRLPEQRVHATIIVDKLVPYVVSKYNDILPIAEHYVETGEISKDNWQIIYNIVNDLISIYNTYEGKNHFCPFFNDISNIKYKEKHELYYNITSKIYMKNFMHHYKIYMNLLDKTTDIAIGIAYISAEHLYYFIACPEKI